MATRDRPAVEFTIRGSEAIAVGTAMLLQYVPSPDGPESYLVEMLSAMQASSETGLQEVETELGIHQGQAQMKSSTDR